MPRSDRSVFSKRHEGNLAKVRVEIPSDIKYLKKISSDILKSLAHYKADNETLFNIRLCVEEAVRNAMVHGNNSDKKLPVKISYWVKDGSINIEIEDKGRGYDYKLLPDPTIGDNMTRFGGRGVYLVLKLMDKVGFNKRGNIIKMSKRLR